MTCAIVHLMRYDPRDPPDLPAREGQRRPYPSSGRHIGPAWRVAYARLYIKRGEWLNGTELAKDASAMHCDFRTLRSLFLKFADAGIIQKKTVKEGQRYHNYYRLPVETMSVSDAKRIMNNGQ